jgi:hypothetical protein
MRPPNAGNLGTVPVLQPGDGGNPGRKPRDGTLSLSAGGKVQVLLPLVRFPLRRADSFLRGEFLRLSKKPRFPGVDLRSDGGAVR